MEYASTGPMYPAIYPTIAPNEEYPDSKIKPLFENDANIDRIVPLFETFICPLTKKVMKDPVTLTNGQTFERKAIEDWFRNHAITNGKLPICPSTFEVLQSTDMIPNIIHRKTIHEWNLMNEHARLVHLRQTISIESPLNDIMRALNYIELLHNKGGSYVNVVRKAQVVPMINYLLKSTSDVVRCRALGLLYVLAKDDQNKEAFGSGDMLRTIVKFLHFDLPAVEREKAAMILYELSKSESMAGMIGEVDGVMFILVGVSSSITENALTVESAGKTLENLEKIEKNAIKLAEVGRVQPLLKLFLRASPEAKFSMAATLCDLITNDDAKIMVVRTAGPWLLDSLQSDDLKKKEMALRILTAVSTNEQSAKLSIEIGIIPPLVNGIFTSGSNQLPSRFKTFSASVLVNLINSGAQVESIVLDQNSHQTLISQGTLRSLLQLISNSTIALCSKLLQLLVTLTNSPTSIRHVVDSIKSSGATTSLLQFVVYPVTDVSLEAMKVLRNVAPFMGKELLTELCASVAITNLIKVASEGNEITEDKAIAIGLLAELPDDNHDVIRTLLMKMAFDIFLKRLSSIINQEIALGSQHSTLYFEGIVKVIAKLTCVPNYQAAVEFVHARELAATFVDLLQKHGFVNVQTASANALANLSLQTRQILSKQTKPRRGSGFFAGPKIKLCKVHGGVCSLRDTYCLLDGGVLNKLVACLQHASDSLILAALGAICTLLDDGVDIEEGALALRAAKGVDPIIAILVSRRSNESLRRRAVWVVERLLRSQEVGQRVISNLNVKPTLIHVYQFGDVETRQIAMNALKSIDILPPISMLFHSTELK